MEISEVCPDCGAERPAWLGSSHYRRDYRHGNNRVCRDGKSPQQAWEYWVKFAKVTGRFL